MAIPRFFSAGLGPALVATVSTAVAGSDPLDWPQWLGPTRDGHYHGTNLALTWPKDGPPQLWRKTVGQGFSSPVVVSNRLFLFHRVQNDEIVDCLDALSGQPVWEAKYPTRYVDDFGFDEGPRATPAAMDGRVYTLGADGMVQCLETSQGRRLWTVDTRKNFGAPKGFFGMTCSPLIEGDAVLLNIGGKDNAGIIALDKSKGTLLWKATSAEASCSSPVVATIRGRRHALFFTRAGLAAVDPVSGKVYFEFPWRPAIQASVNAATPLVIEESVFISTSYNRGAVLLRVLDKGPETRWASDDVLSNHYETSVHHNGYLYGFDGRQEQGGILRCVQWATGKIQWSQDGLGTGSVTVARDHLWILTERGELLCAPATPRAFEPLHRAQVLGFHVRARPAFAHGRLFARDKSQLLCLDLRSEVVSR